MATSEGEKQTCWYVMRDLKRANAKLPAYKQLLNEHFEVFTPMKEQLSVHGGKRTREEVPFIQDLLFVHDTQEAIDPFVEKYPTIQYRFQKGGGYKNPMTVADADMERFIHAVSVSEKSEILSSWRIDTLYVRTAHPYCRRFLWTVMKENC